ncbi:hypothetical protein J6590_080430 [Homalodisca vitripennis]|nr:hypothetical protein J6590_080430 [Homalodisca vitripennis]
MASTGEILSFFRLRKCDSAIQFITELIYRLSEQRCRAREQRRVTDAPAPFVSSVWRNNNVNRQTTLEKLLAFL